MHSLRRLLASLLCLPLVFVASYPAQPPVRVTAEANDKKDSQLASLPERETRCTNGSVIKLRILDENLTLTTAYGKLLIPLDKIVEIDCATRISDADAGRIRAAVAALASEEIKTRDAATAELTRLKLKAYPALLEAAHNPDAEVQRRAEALLEVLRTTYSEEELEVRPADIVHTADSRITGKIEPTAFKVHTEQFGEVVLNLAEIRHIQLSSGALEREGGDILPTPFSVAEYGNQRVGQILTFRVTGAPIGQNGVVYGMNPYTTDSSLAHAAVHAGVVKPGQAGTVRVKILPPVVNFPGGQRNGVPSFAYRGPYPAYEIVVKKP